MIINVDGKKYHFENEVEQKTGTDEVSQFKDMRNGELEIKEPTESGEMLKVLNEDMIEHHTRMSGIDMKAHLGDYELQTVLAVDALVGMGVLPSITLALTRSKKRLSRSREGFGSEQMVRMINGHQENKQGGGFMDRLKGGLGGNRQ